MKAFILAGGFATRLWPLTEKRAKPLLPLAGKPMLTHIVEQIPADIPVTVSTNAAFGEGFEEWKKTIAREHVTIAIEQTTHDDQKLGTNGAVAQWILQEKIDDDLLLIAGDNYMGFSMNTFIAQFKGSPLLAAYDIGDLSEASRYGTVITDASGRVTAFEEKPREPKTTLVSTGCYLIPASCLPVLVDYAKDHPDHIGGIFEEFLKRGIAVESFGFTEPWFDIGSFESYIEATRTLVRDNHISGPGSSMENTECTGSIVMGHRCRVTNSKLEDVVLFDDCIIDDCVLEKCIVDNGCTLKNVDLSGKMLREGTKLVRA